MQIISTQFIQHFYENCEVLTVDRKTDILFEMCHFITNITAIGFYHIIEGSKPPEINLRMSQSSFSLKNSNKDADIIYFLNELQVSWKLWKTEFQLNYYHTMSNNTKFKKNLDRIITIDPQGPFPGTVSETQYASGKDWK